MTVADRGAVNLGGYQLSYTDESVITHYGVLVGGDRLDALGEEYKWLASADRTTKSVPTNCTGCRRGATIARSPGARTDYGRERDHVRAR